MIGLFTFCPHPRWKNIVYKTLFTLSYLCFLLCFHDILGLWCSGGLSLAGHL